MPPVRRVMMAAMVTVCCLPAGASAQNSDATLPSRCLNQQIAPLSVVLACGDGGFTAEGLAWSDWGSERPTATGTASVNPCDPDCATGGREEYPITLIASEMRDCTYGKPQYTLVTYSFPGATPFPPGRPVPRIRQSNFHAPSAPTRTRGSDGCRCD